MPERSATFSLDFYNLIETLSGALDLVGGRINGHGKIVAYIALTLAEGLGLPPEEFDDLRTAALLHNAGVSRTSVHEQMRRLDWDKASQYSREGAELLGVFDPFARPAKIVLHQRARWDRLAASDTEPGVALSANLVFLAGRIDALLNWDRELLLNRERAEREVKELGESYFNPDVIKVFLEKSRIEAFWLSLSSRHVRKALTRFRPPEPREVGLSELEIIASIFARIVDNKSSYTRRHSEGVANLCHMFGTKMNLTPLNIQKLRIAGLLHDLGKLAVPDEVLEKPAVLTADEFQIIKRHPFETYQILDGLPGLEEIRDWAAFHHEKADGSGYPFHLKQQQLHLEHIIVIVSDMIQALVQDRPYRSGLSKDNLLDILEHMADKNTIFEPLIKIVRTDFDEVTQVARVQEKTE